MQGIKDEEAIHPAPFNTYRTTTFEMDTRGSTIMAGGGSMKPKSNGFTFTKKKEEKSLFVLCGALALFQTVQGTINKRRKGVQFEHVHSTHNNKR